MGVNVNMEMRYIAYRSCGCVQGWVVVGGMYGTTAKEAAKMVAKWVKDGCKIDTRVGEDTNLPVPWDCPVHEKE